MAFIESRACDGCGAVVEGMVNNKRVSIDSFEIHGSAALQFRKALPHSHTFVSRKPDDYMIFCLKPGLPCLQQFIDRRRAYWQFRNRSRHDEIESERDRASREYLRQEAEREAIARAQMENNST